MTKFEYAEKTAERSATRAFYRSALAKYEAALKMVARAKAELEARESAYMAVERFAAA